MTTTTTSINYPYSDYGGSVRWSYSDMTTIQEVYVELGPSGTPGSVSITVGDVSKVTDSTGITWKNSQQTFDTPTADPLTITMYSAATAGDTEKLKIYVKPNGGLPGESPV